MGTTNIALAHLLAYHEGSRAIQVISGRLPFLGETDRKIGAYIIANPAQAAALSSSELAEVAGVSEASVFRFLSRVGYSYNDLRVALVKHVELTRVFCIAGTSELKPPDAVLDRTEKGVRSLCEAYAYVSPDNIERAARVLYGARRIQVYGLGPISAPMAEIVAYKLNNLGCTAVIRKNVQSVDIASYSPRPTPNGHDDVLLAISHSGCNPQLLEAIEHHNRRDGITIAITNYEGSPIGEAATIPLITGTRESVIQQVDLIPRLAQLLVIEILLETVERIQDTSSVAEAP